MTGPYTAEVHREGRWWVIHVVELDVVTQAARWSEVKEMARGVVVATLDLEEDAAVDLALVPVFGDEVGALLARAQRDEQEAERLTATAAVARRSALESLRRTGWTLHGIAAGLGVSHQRVEQLLKAGERRRSVAVEQSPSPPRHVTTSTAHRQIEG